MIPTRALSVLTVIALLTVVQPLANAQTPLSTAFTYQGLLKTAGTPVSGTADLQFTLYDTESLGTIVAGPITSVNVSLANGLFTTTLDFGSAAFNGEARWLEIAVRSPAGSGSYTILNPRQALTATPYALKVAGIDGHSLDAADGSPVDAVFVNNDGLIGIGTTSPMFPLHVETSAERSIYSLNTATSGTSFGVYALASSNEGRGVYGLASASSGASCGVIGASLSSSGTGVIGRAYASSGATYGVFGDSNSPGGHAIHGLARSDGGVAGFFENASGNNAPALQTIGDALVQGRGWPSGGAESRLLLGDANYYIKAVAGNGMRLGTFGAPDSVALNGANVGIGTTAPSYPLHVEATDGSAVYGRATRTTGLVSGVIGQSDSGAGWGVHGTATAADGFGWGVYGESHGTGGRGVVGWARASSGSTCGLFGQSDSPDGHGVHGWVTATTGSTSGVFGETESSGGHGIHGLASANGGIAGYFENASGNTAPALQTIGDALVRGRNWPSGGVESRLLLGDDNHYIKSVPGQGVRIGTFGGVDLVRLQEGSGLMGIGRTPTANKLEVEGNASKTVAGDWLANSDARIKTNVHTVTNALDTLDKVRLVSFRYADEYRCEHPDIADRQYVNVIAQEFAGVFPDYVKASGETLPDGSGILQVDPYPLTVYSAAAVQELHAMVKQKDAQIATQQAEIDELSARLARVEQLVNAMVADKKGGSR